MILGFVLSWEIGEQGFKWFHIQLILKTFNHKYSFLKKVYNKRILMKI